jgi:hypothetical protein
MYKITDLKKSKREKTMRKKSIGKKLIFVLVIILIGATFEGTTATPQYLIATTPQKTLPISSHSPQEQDLSSYLACFDTDTLQSIHQAQAAGLDMYVVFSTSGTGRAIHLLLKIPHLRNSRGVFVFGMIVYSGLTAMTTVWRLQNGTNGTLVDAQIGPHGVMFIGVGYSTYNKNFKGSGAGTMLGVSPLQPFLFP